MKGGIRRVVAHAKASEYAGFGRSLEKRLRHRWLQITGIHRARRAPDHKPRPVRATPIARIVRVSARLGSSPWYLRSAATSSVNQAETPMAAQTPNGAAAAADASPKPFDHTNATTAPHVTRSVGLSAATENPTSAVPVLLARASLLRSGRHPTKTA